jgi:hypothetical protein
MKIKIVSLLIVLICTCITSISFAQKRTVAGVELPAKLSVNDKTVIYNGGGLREKYTIDLYVGALYLRRPSMDANKIINDDAEMAIRIELVSNKVTRDKFVESVIEGFEKSDQGKSTKDEIDAFMKFYDDAFTKGDIISIIYQPGKGVDFSKNGDLRGTIKGLPFKKALFGIWLGSDPADSSLKDDMLGKV